jgi:hypothetical protein
MLPWLGQLCRTRFSFSVLDCRRKFWRQGGRYADFIVPNLPGAPLLSSHLAQANKPPAVANANLRRAEHQESVRKARRCRAVNFKVADYELARTQLHCRQVLDINCAVP